MLRTLKIWFIYSLRNQIAVKILNICIAIILCTFVILYQFGTTDKTLSVLLYVLLALILTNVTAQVLLTTNLRTLLKNNILYVLLSNRKSISNYLLWIIYVPLLLAFFSDMFFQVNIIVVILIIIPYLIIRPLSTVISSFFIKKLN